MEYQASAVINASPEKIWNVLTDLSRWPTWDPYCEKVEGRVGLGEKVKVFTKLSPGRAFPVKVAELSSNKKMVWQGGMPFGLFKGVRTYTLEPSGDGKVTFTMHEVFSGPLVGLIGKSIPNMTVPFREFVDGLKKRAEASK